MPGSDLDKLPVGGARAPGVPQDGGGESQATPLCASTATSGVEPATLVAVQTGPPTFPIESSAAAYGARPGSGMVVVMPSPPRHSPRSSPRLVGTSMPPKAASPRSFKTMQAAEDSHARGLQALQTFTLDLDLSQRRSSAGDPRRLSAGSSPRSNVSRSAVTSSAASPTTVAIDMPTLTDKRPAPPAPPRADEATLSTSPTSIPITPRELAISPSERDSYSPMPPAGPRPQTATGASPVVPSRFPTRESAGPSRTSRGKSAARAGAKAGAFSPGSRVPSGVLSARSRSKELPSIGATTATCPTPPQQRGVAGSTTSAGVLGGVSGWKPPASKIYRGLQGSCAAVSPTWTPASSTAYKLARYHCVAGTVPRRRNAKAADRPHFAESPRSAQAAGEEPTRERLAGQLTTTACATEAAPLRSALLTRGLTQAQIIAAQREAAYERRAKMLEAQEAAIEVAIVGEVRTPRAESLVMPPARMAPVVVQAVLDDPQVALLPPSADAHTQQRNDE